MWLWGDTDYLSYDFGGRVEEFVSFIYEKQFADEAHKLASIARDRVLQQRERFRACRDVALCLAGQGLLTSQWRMLHMGIAYGCAGDFRSAQTMLGRLSESTAEFDWQENLVQRAHYLAKLICTPIEFRKYVEEAIFRTRSRLKLPDLDGLALTD